MSRIDYQTLVKNMDGEERDLGAYQGKVLLIVNTASKCGFTPQFKGLQALHQELVHQGLVVLGFPCNQFGGQDPGSNKEIASFCADNYGVNFIMHQRIEVNGKGAHPLFQQLKKAAPGLLGSTKIKWNFTKFLVAKDGTILERFGPRTKPAAIMPKIQAALNA